MEINHVTGGGVDTDKLNDVDAILMEESAKLHKLFAQYNRQLFLIGEMKATKDTSAEEGCVFSMLTIKLVMMYRWLPKPSIGL